MEQDILMFRNTSSRCRFVFYLYVSYVVCIVVVSLLLVLGEGGYHPCSGGIIRAWGVSSVQ
jgi:hypothetical protein